MILMTNLEVFLNYGFYFLLLIGSPILVAFLIYQFFYKPHFIKKMKLWGLDENDNPFH